MPDKSRRIAFEIIAGLLLISAAFLWRNHRTESLWPSGRVHLDSGYRETMGTIAHLIAVAADEATAKKCVETGFNELVLVDNLMSDYKSDSQIGIVNRNAFEHSVRVSDSVFEVLQKSVEYSRKSSGAFDITIGPLVDLWHKAGEANSTPSEKQLAEAKAKVGYEKLILDDANKTVRFAVQGMRLDLGAIAKGYAVDKATEAMQRAGAIGGMVDAGGNIRCFGAPPAGKDAWLIGLQDPQSAIEGDMGGNLSLVLRLINESVATSGDYRRFVLIGGKRYSHIINPSTSSTDSEFESVTIISKTAIDADALSTAVSVLGLKKGMELIENTADTEAILIPADPNGKIITSTGAATYIKSENAK